MIKELHQWIFVFAVIILISGIMYWASKCGAS